MNAVILAGGFGSRLRPLTDEIIKPMLPLANVPMIDYSVAHLYDFGIKDFVFTLAHNPEQIIQWTLGYKHIKCHYCIETTPLGTLGGVKAAYKLLDDTFIVLSGDALENIDLAALAHKHSSSNAAVTMAVKRVEQTHRYGVVEFDAWGNVLGFEEKPKKGEQKSNYINCGVYMVQKSVLKNVPDFVKMDFARDLFPSLLKCGIRMSVYIHDDYWCDIGDTESYYKANFDVFDGGFYTPVPCSCRIDYASFHAGTKERSLLSASAKVAGVVDECIIGSNAVIRSGAVLSRCIVMPNTVVKGRYSEQIIGSDFTINARSNSDTHTYLQNSLQNYKYFS